MEKLSGEYDRTHLGLIERKNFIVTNESKEFTNKKINFSTVL